MKNTIAAPCRLLPLLLCIGIACISQARAEMDYEYGKALIERNAPGFPTDDLVERLIVKLEAGSESKLEAMLIKASLRRKQAERASVEKRKELLDQAEALYREFQATGAKHRLSTVAESESSSLRGDMVKAQISAAKELAQKDPKKAAAVRLEAAQTMEKIAEQYKTAMEAAQPKFKAAFEAFKKWSEKENPEGEKQPPRDLLVPLDKTFTEWIVADRRYIASKVEQVNCYDEAAPERKTLAETLIKTCEERMAEEAIGSFPLMGAWYAMMQGRLHAATGKDDKASEAWNNALTMTSDMVNLSPDQTRQLLAMKRMILHDLVKLRINKGKYSEVVDIIGQSLMDNQLRPLFDEPSGKELMIDYAKSMVLQAEAGTSDFENAIKTLRNLIEKENRTGQTLWAGRFSLAIAEIAKEARKRKINPRLSAGEWYDAARGFFITGQAEHQKFLEYQATDPKDPKVNEQYQLASEQFELAVDYYRRSISVARNPQTELYSRLLVEPKAWFEMGICYVKTQQYLEAVLAYQTLRDTFGAEYRNKWLPDPNKPEGKRLLTKEVMALFAEYDKPKEGLLPRGSTNLLVSLDKHISGNKDVWSSGLKGRILEDMKDDPASDSGINDSDYITAKAAMEMGRTLAAAAKSSKEAKSATETYQQALAKYVEAGDRFLKVKQGSKAYETAQYQAGSCFTMAQEALASGRIPGKKEDLDARVAEATKKALDSFRTYEEVIAKNAPVDDEEKNRRQNLRGAVLLARGALLLGSRQWEAAATSADEYVAWEAETTVAKSSKAIAFLNKYRALIELASITLAPKSEPYLEQAEKTLKEWRAVRPKDNTTYVFMVNALSRRYLIAAAQAAKLNLEKALVEKYELKLTELQWSRIEMMAASDADDLALEDYTRMLSLFNKTGQDKRAADWAVRLLAKFDPENKNCKIPDEEVVWVDMLERMYKIIRYDDLQKWDRCKKDHRLLLDFMYDTSKGRAYDELSEKRPEADRYNFNLAKARAQLDTLRGNFPDCKTLSPALGENNRSMLQMIEDEIDFRQKIEATRDLLSTISLNVAAQIEKEQGGKEEAMKYREIANQQIKILLDVRGETPAMQIKSAEIDKSNGKYEDALTTLYNVLDDADKSSTVYFDAKRHISETMALMKKWNDAVEFPEFVAMTASLDAQIVKERWPSMKAFLQDCYKNGAKQPERMKEILSAEPKPQAPAKPDSPAKTDDAVKSAEPTKTGEAAKSEQPPAESKSN